MRVRVVTGAGVAMHVSAVVAALVLAAPAAVPPTAPQPDCGDLVTRDVTLQRDLYCEKGLELAPGVTLDLGGHLLRGPGDYAGTGVTGPQAGGATVRNGEVRAWGFGIAGVRGGSLRVEDVSVSATFGVDQTGGGVLTVEGSRISGDHRALTCSGTCDVRSTVVEGNEIGTGIDCSRGGWCAVSTSTIRGFEIAAVNLASMTDSVVRDNASGATFSGYRVLVARNHVERNGGGVRVDSAGATVVDNVFRANETGLDVQTPSAPATDVVGNLFTQNATGMTSRSRDVTLRRNVAVGNDVGIDAPYATQADWNVGVEPAP